MGGRVMGQALAVGVVGGGGLIVRNEATTNSSAIAALVRRVPPLVAVLVLAMSAVVTLGWALQVRTLQSFAPGLVTMKANAALGLGMAAGALLLVGSRRRRGPQSRHIALALAGLVTAIGAATLAQYALHADFGIDQLVFRADADAVHTMTPGRMAALTAFCFVLIGCALLAMGLRSVRAQVPAQLLAGAAGALGLTSLLGHVYGAIPLVGQGHGIQIAFHTAVAFVLLAAGVLASGAHVGWMPTLLSDRSGGVLARRLLPVAFVVPLSLGALRLLGQRVGLKAPATGSAIVAVATMLDSAPVGFAFFDRNLRYLRANRANRALFRDRVEHALARAAQGDRVAVLFLDLDDFKAVNDSFGHAEGDRLLETVAARLLKATRGCDTVARLGGDEFAILLAGLAQERDAVVVVERITAAMRPPVALRGREVLIGASIGVAHVGVGQGVDEVLRNADLAMYRAKAAGKGGHEVFEPGMHTAVLERLELEADLRRAVEREELRLLYQPIVELASGRTIGADHASPRGSSPAALRLWPTIAAMTMGFAHVGIDSSGAVSRMVPSAVCSNSRGSGRRPCRGGASSLLSKTAKSVSRGRRRIRLRRLRSYRSRIFASGMSWPPAAARARTRAMCNSGPSNPTYRTWTSSPASSAASRQRVMVVPPSVVSKA